MEKTGYLKCRLLHFRDRGSVIQPDLIFCGSENGVFHVPRFFDPNLIRYGQNDENLCQVNIEVADKVEVRTRFSSHDHVVTYRDGSVLYRCCLATSPSVQKEPRADGRWRSLDAGCLQVHLYHHTDKKGLEGIRDENFIRASRKNIDGSLQLQNIQYCYFTNIGTIRTTLDLQAIAMSDMGSIYLLPTNAPLDIQFASRVKVPSQTPNDRTQTISLWIDIDLLAPNHLLIHHNENRMIPYYETVLPNVFRIGLRPGEGRGVKIQGDIGTVARQNRKQFEYIVVGNADVDSGLRAPFHEESAQSIADVETLAADTEIIRFWRQNANSNLVFGEPPELVRGSPAAPPLD